MLNRIASKEILLIAEDTTLKGVVKVEFSIFV